MTHTWSEDVIAISTLADGGVRVGPYPVGAGGLATIPLSGGTAYIDPATPHCPPSVEISDPVAAFDILTELYGVAVAESCLELENASLPTQVSLSRWSSLAPTALLRDVSTLGTLLWLARNSAQPLHLGLLGLETTQWALRCRQVLDDGEGRGHPEEFDGPARDLEVLAAELLELATTDSRHGYSAPIRRLVHEVLAAWSRQLPATDTRQTLLAQVLPDLDEVALSTRDDGRATAASPTGSSWWDDFIASCSSIGAVHASADEDPSGTMYTFSTTAAWSRNSPGFVSRDEDAVTWSIELDAAERASISVVVGRAPQPLPVGQPDLPGQLAGPFVRDLQGLNSEAFHSGHAAVSVHVPSWPLPLAEQVLTVHPQAGTLAGSLVVDGLARSALVDALRRGTIRVDVHDAGQSFAHLRAPAAVEEEATRWAARGICALRLWHTAPRSAELPQAAFAALVRAETLWTASGAAAAVPRDLAVARALHCRGLAALVHPSIPSGTASYADPLPQPWFAPAIQGLAEWTSGVAVSETERAVMPSQWG